MANLNTTAGQLQIEDYIKTHISGSGGLIMLRSTLNPPTSESPFGDFPGNYARPRHKNIPPARRPPPPVDPDTFGKTVVNPSEFQRRQAGIGGRPSTLLATFKPERPLPPAPVSGAYRRRSIPKTQFRRFYERGDMPVAVEHHANGNHIHWKVEPEKLDYHHYLPLFFEGLREKEEPYRFLAVQGTFDLLSKGGSKILPVIPQLIIPIKTALNTRDLSIICAMLKVVQALVTSADMVGEALVPYYRQILPVFNIFKNNCTSMGDGIDYAQRKHLSVGELIEETLQLLEQHGGEDAFINIKYMIPTYESCVLN